MCICIVGNSNITKHLYGAKYICTGYLDSEKQLIKFEKKHKQYFHFRLKNSISYPLGKIISKNLERFSFSCPSRFDNKVLFSVFLKASQIIFAGFKEYIGGTCIVKVNSDIKSKLPFVYLYKFDVSMVQEKFS